MNIHYKLHRAKNNEVIEDGIIQLKLEEEGQVVALDDLIVLTLDNYIKSIPIIKKYGTAYIGYREICFVEIIDEDKIELPKEAFIKFVRENINPNLIIQWNKHNSNT